MGIILIWNFFVWRQLKFAFESIINTTQQQYSKIESGKSEPTAEKLIKLSSFYKVSVDYILGLSNKK